MYGKTRGTDVKEVSGTQDSPSISRFPGGQSTHPSKQLKRKEAASIRSRRGSTSFIVSSVHFFGPGGGDASSRWLLLLITRQGQTEEGILMGRARSKRVGSLTQHLTLSPLFPNQKPVFFVSRCVEVECDASTAEALRKGKRTR